MNINILKKEYSIVFIGLTTIIFLSFSDTLLRDMSVSFGTAILFVWLFSIMLWASFGVVKHADALAVKLGEPYGTLILTLSVISIEVIMISTVMLTGAENPSLGRDMMFAVLMIVLNGLVGFAFLLGGLRHLEQQYNLRGANTFLTVLIPLAIIGLVIPNYTRATAVGTYSISQMVFVVVVTIALYVTFIFGQTIKYKGFFKMDDDEGHEDHGDLAVHTVSYHSVMLIAYMLPIVLMSKSLAKIVDFGIAEAGAPAALGGLIVAVLVLSPEGMAAVKAALTNNMMRAINLSLGSALATIGLTIPAVLLISLITGSEIILGLGSVDLVLLVLTLIMIIVNLSSGRSNIIHGIVHLIIFAAYIMFIFD